MPAMNCTGYWRKKSKGLMGCTARLLCESQVVILLSAVYCTQRSRMLTSRRSALRLTPMLMLLKKEVMVVTLRLSYWGSASK